MAITICILHMHPAGCEHNIQGTLKVQINDYKY